MKNWTISDAAGGLLAQLCLPDGVHPSDSVASGWAWGDGHVAVEQEEQADPAAHRFADGQWQLDAEQVDNRLHQKIDEEAGAFRCRFITEIPGQQLTYQRKEAEARQWLGELEPDPALFPFLAAEASATDADIGALAAEVVANADAWTALGAAIEAARIGAKRAVSAASDLAAKHAAAAVNWESLAP